jgi:hypothetical protein
MANFVEEEVPVQPPGRPALEFDPYELEHLRLDGWNWKGIADLYQVNPVTLRRWIRSNDFADPVGLMTIEDLPDEELDTLIRARTAMGIIISIGVVTTVISTTTTTCAWGGMDRGILYRDCRGQSPDIGIRLVHLVRVNVLVLL